MPEEINEEQNEDTPVLSVELDALKGHKTGDGLNFFSDDHLERLNVWGSDDPTKAKFRTEDGKVDVPKLTKSYLEAQARIAKMSNPLPEDASEADKIEYRKNLARMMGVPETPDEYQIIYPDGVKPDKDFENEIKILAHKHNVTKEGLQAFSDLNQRREEKARETLKKSVKDQNTESETLLKAEMGPEDYVASNQLLKRYLAKFTTDDEQAEEVFKHIQGLYFPGSMEIKKVFMKAMFQAAKVAEGEGKSIYSEYHEKMTKEQELKDEFPKSHEDLKD